MELWELLDIRPGITALTGGGKTTTMYTLARELSRRATFPRWEGSHLLIGIDIRGINSGEDPGYFT